MRKIILSLFTICFLIEYPGSLFVACAQGAPALVVVTHGQLGFKEGDKLYTLGMKGSDFERQFGPPEERSNIGTGGYLANCTVLDYTTDGLEVIVDPDGKIKCFTFYLTYHGIFKPANASTDTGIRAGVSLRQIVKIQGEPYARKDIDIDEIEDHAVFYKYDELVLGFNFKQGEFYSITLAAGYISYLPKTE